jgi:hypothetical protein
VIEMTTYHQAPHAPDSAVRPRSNGLAIAGMVCGVVGLLVASMILGPLAVVFGGVGLSRARRGAPYRGMAIAAIVLGVVDIVLFFVLLAVVSHNGGGFYFHAG